MRFFNKTTLLCTIMIICSLNCISAVQQGSLPAYQKEIIFIDDFNAVANDWSVGSFNNGCRLSSMANSDYIIISLCNNENPLFWTNSIAIDQNRDFEIETSIQFVSGEDNNVNALVWGMDTNNHFRFRFGISGNGQYLIDKFAGAWYTIKGWTYSPMVVRNQHNILTVRKIGFIYYFYLNRNLVHTTTYEPFFNQKIGFQGNQNTEMRVDYLKVAYLK